MSSTGSGSRGPPDSICHRQVVDRAGGRRLYVIDGKWVAPTAGPYMPCAGSGSRMPPDATCHRQVVDRTGGGRPYVIGK